MIYMAHVVRTFVLYAEGFEFESRLRQTQVVKTDGVNSTAKRSATGASFTVPRR